ncbi:unnamed protein product [Cylicocyclus nassatus]|uniref:Uncharacterized protein n=1 Tax=Cylicocyclus nassatus TaxID=53992 RepID=A0AA36HGS2_CYLNA|nr:unnamed protein product [Cylicocyclus nassatus]
MWSQKRCYLVFIAICNTSGKLPTNTFNYQLIDLLNLPSGCIGKYYVPIDSTSPMISVEVSAAGKAFVNLTDSNGKVWPSEGIVNDGYTLTRYINLPAGPYQLTIDNGGVPTSNCLVEITSYTALSIVQAFSSSPQSDEAPFYESAIDGVPMYFISHVNNMTAPGDVRAVTIRTQATLTPTYRSLLTKRYGCSFEYYAGQFICDKSNRYVYHIDGVDSLGYAFRRTGTFSCMQQITTAAPSTTPRTQIYCVNGGTPLRQGTVNASCFCPELFTGETCEQVNCMNGGTPLQGNLQCQCPPGFEGTNCESVTCKINLGPMMTDYKSLVVVLRTTTSMSGYVSQIVNAITDEIGQHSGFNYDVYNNYILVQFANGKYQTTFYTRDYIQRFIDDIMAAIYTTNVGGCEEQTFNAISSVFVQNVNPKSAIYVFTDAVASDVDQWRTVTETNTRRKLPIYTMFLPNANCTVNQYSEGYRALQRASEFSGGLTQQPNLTSLEKIFQYTMKATSYKMNSVLTDDMNQCDTKGFRIFFIDSSADSVIIFAVGQDLILSVTDPNWNKSAALLVYNSGTSYFWEVPNVIPGEHLLSITSQNPQTSCSYRVMSHSDYDLFFGTANVIDEDASDSEPVVGKAKHIVAQLNGLYNAVQDRFRLFAEITITTNINRDNQERKPMYFSSGKYRDGCGYHLYFGLASFCEFADQQFYATVYADDNNGYTIQRTTTGYCSMTETTPAPPSACQNGGVPDPTNNSSCICPPSYSGAHCESAICQNGGTSYGTFCECVPGTGGTFCELHACTETNSKPHVSFDGQSMSLVLSVRDTMQATLNSISDGITDFVRDVQDSSSNWIRTWNLVVVNSLNATMVYTGSNPNDFVKTVQMVANNLNTYSSPNPVNCSVAIEAGLLLATYASQPRSAVYLFADSDGGNDDTFVTLFSTATEYQITLNLIGVGNTICTAPENNGQFPLYLQSLSAMTSGFVYMTTKPALMLPFISSLYKSGIASSAYFDDCSNATYYVPIDSSTAAFTLAVSASNISSVTITLPDGSAGLNSILSVPLISDPELNIQQFIQACDGYQWNYREQYCYRFNFNKLTFVRANQFCHSIGGYMVDIHSQQKDDYIRSQTNGAKSWIGLIRNNKDWVWDVPDGNSFQSIGNFTNWAPGVDPNNTAYSCVALDQNGQWVPTDCNEENYAVCQRHRFGQGFTPGNNTSTVPAGLWKVQIQGQGSCGAQVRAQSDIQVFFGFTVDPNGDYPELYANSLSQNNYLVADAVGLSPFHYDVLPSLEGRLNYAILGYNYNMTTPLIMADRWQCGYPQVSNAFKCPQQGSFTDFFIKFSGIDQYGYAFERFTNAICAKPTLNCKNGFPTNEKCVCYPGYTGADCGIPICQNYGYVDGTKCECLPAYTGTFCEQALCLPPYPTTFSDIDRTFVIMLETSYNMGATIFQMKRSLKAAFEKINTDPTTKGWFSKFILYPFDSESNKIYWYPPVISTNSDDIVAAVNNITTTACPGPNGCSPNCPRPIMATLKEVLNMTELAKPNSVILVVTRSTPEDYNLVNGMIQQLMESRAQINFVLTGTSSPCGEGWNTPASNSLYTATSYSDGDVFVMSPTDFTMNFLQQYVPSLYRSGGLDVGGTPNCNYDEFLFQVEHGMYEFTLSYYHPVVNPPVAVTLTDPAGDSISLPPNLISSDTNYLGVLRVNDSGAVRAGTYCMTMSGAGGQYCQLNIRGRSSIEIYPAYVRTSDDAWGGATNDKAHFAPVMDENNTIVVHADGLGDGILTYVQVANAGVGLQYTSTLMRRSNSCSYEYYAPVPFVCTYEQNIVMIYGRDSMGATIRRNYITNCVPFRPDLPPPVPTCDLGAVMQDTLFIIDASYQNANSEDNFKSLRDFAIHSQLPYRFANDTAQVAAMTLADTPKGGFSFNAPEHSFDNVQMLLSNLTFLNKAGQNLSSAMDLAVTNYSTPNQGYRTAAKHILIYVTSTNPTDDDPASRIYAIRRQGTYQIAIVTVGLTPSQKLLSSVSKDCMYQAKNVDDLMTNGMNFVQGLSCAIIPRC